MAVILSHVFACCLSRKSSKSKITDEESRLIPEHADINPSDTSLPDGLMTHQTMKERMLDIVRAKESKMVNVTTRMPFNLHSKNVFQGVRGPLVGPCSLSPSYSRSASTSSLPQDLRHAIPPLSPNYASRLRLNHTLSRNSSMTFHIDRAANEICPENDDYDERSGSGSLVRALRQPAFNIRLVRGLALRGHTDCHIRRGRSKRKAGSEGGDSPGAPDSTSGVLYQESEDTSGSEPLVNGQVRTSTPGSGTMPLNSREGAESAPILSISPTSTLDFKLQDMGPLVVAWDD